MKAALLLAAVLAAEPVNLRAGEVAPFDGALCDKDCAESIRKKRLQCEDENKRLQQALMEQPQQATPSGYVIAGLVGVLVGVLATGAVVAYAVTRK